MKKAFIFIILLCLLTACSLPKPTAEPTATFTPEPTGTPEPTAEPTAPAYYAVVNGVYVRIDDVDAERERIRDAYREEGSQIPDDETLQTEAMDAVTGEALFYAEAQRRGLVPDPSEIDARIASLSGKLGGDDSLRDWQERNHYDEESFRRALERQSAAEAVKAQLLEEKLPEVTYYHVYRMYSPTRSDMTGMSEKLDMGVSFIELAADWEDGADGDMGWVTDGVILVPEVEKAVLSLEVGAHSEIIEYNGTYNLFFLAEKQNGRDPDPAIRRTVEHNILSAWLDEQKAGADITTSGL